MDKGIELQDIFKELYSVYIKNFFQLTIPALLYALLYVFYLKDLTTLSITFGPDILKEILNIRNFLNIFCLAYLAFIYINMISSLYKNEEKSYSEYFFINPTILLGLIAVYCLITIGTSVGYLLLVVPGLMLTYGWVLALPVYLNEDDENILTSISRSWELTTGSKWQIFGLYFLIGLAKIIFILCIGLILKLTPYSDVAFPGGKFLSIYSSDVYLLLSYIVAPIDSVLSVVIYFKLINKDTEQKTEILDDFGSVIEDTE